MEDSTKKSKLLTNSTSNISANISLNGQMLESVTSFKYLGATLCNGGEDCLNNGSNGQTRQDNYGGATLRISFASKFRLCKSLVAPIILYFCETAC